MTWQQNVRNLKPCSRSEKKKGSPLSAGYDLSSASEIKVPARGKALVPTDLRIAVPEGTYARIAPRSGLAWKHSIDVGAGVIDADYRGPVGVILFNYSDVDFEVKAGDMIAQLIIAIFPHFSCASLFVKTPYFVLKYQGRISRKYTVLPEIYFSIAFKDPQAGVKPPGVWKTFLGVISQVRTTNNLQRCKLISGLDIDRYVVQYRASEFFDTTLFNAISITYSRIKPGAAPLSCMGI
ncbi:hypothetical protein POM88_009008 [Heracleum sosnowskyi]|uniref:Deoxyuridine 5'-triphosphate nucleotidohydrolase n=1 Tax=Heracleum sosnowskyi TaxID=360622 RepID=A0AAD8JAW7_9APIA|nr:hypothetical protein POM88_009008 [Heracleum sosnowskyi]